LNLKLLTKIILGCGFYFFLLQESVLAFPIKVQLAQQSRLDPNTGLNELIPINPDGFADLKFIPSGLEFAFINSAGEIQSLRIFFEFNSYILQTNTALETANVYNRALTEARKNGSLMAAQILKSIYQSDKPLVLYFNMRGKIAAVPVDFEASRVQLRSSLNGTSEQSSFEEIVFNSFYLSANNYFLKTQQEAQKMKNNIEAVLRCNDAI
jgi:hypothetical protein